MELHGGQLNVISLKGGRLNIPGTDSPGETITVSQNGTVVTIDNL